LQAKQDLIRKYEGKAKPDPGQTDATYAAMIQSVDESVGRILDLLDSLQIADHTPVFFMSDNGGLIGVTSNAPLRGGKGMLYEGGIREPMIVRWPGTIPSNRVCDDPVISVDFFPTILEMAGVKRPHATMDGSSFAPSLNGGQVPGNRSLYWHYPHYSPQGGTPASAIRNGDHKLIEFYEDQRLELYDLKNDLSETHNLAESMPEKVAELRRDLHAWLKAVDASMPTASHG
jgi:arylsulfatase A-like enzyme